MSKRNPYNEDPGYRSSRIFKPSGCRIVIYEAAEAGLDAGGHRYAIVCPEHGSIDGAPSMPKARVIMKAPRFCEGCHGVPPAFEDRGALARWNASRGGTAHGFG